jgi:hypothetical protein
MFKAMILGFLAGVAASQTIENWASGGRANADLSVLLHIDAYEKLTAALH